MNTKSAIMGGGGIAGLAAAWKLCHHGVPTTVLEAQDRWGGRIHTVHHGRQSIELGAEFVHGRDPGLLQVIKDARLKTTTAADTHGVWEKVDASIHATWETAGPTRGSDGFGRADGHGFWRVRERGARVV